MRPFLVVLSLLVIAALAGCSSSPTPTDSSAPAPTTSAAPMMGPAEVKRVNGTVTYGANSGVVSTTNGADPVEITVTNATLLLFEMKWDSQFDLNLCVNSPTSGSTGPAQNCDNTNDGGNAGSPDTPFKYVVKNPKKGAWAASPTSGLGGAVNVNYQIAVTQFHGETAVPSGYTALV